MQTTSNTLEQAVQFADNGEPRCPCVLIVDTSTSMEDEPIEQLNAGLRQLHKELQQDGLASKRVEVAIVSFNSVVNVEQDLSRLSVLTRDRTTLFEPGVVLGVVLENMRADSERKHALIN